MAGLNMQELMAKAKEMQQQMQKAQQDLLTIEITGESGGGLVKVRLNGAHHCLGIQISPTLLNEDEDVLEDLVRAAFNSAVNKIEGITKNKMVEIAKDMKLPQDYNQDEE